AGTESPAAGVAARRSSGSWRRGGGGPREPRGGLTPPASVTVTVVGRGRAVIGGTLHAPLTPDDVKKVIFDGFFPQVPAGAEPQRGARAGLHEMGLPYVSDPAGTRHPAAFLQRQARAGGGRHGAGLV